MGVEWPPTEWSVKFGIELRWSHVNAVISSLKRTSQFVNVAQSPWRSNESAQLISKSQKKRANQKRSKETPVAAAISDEPEVISRETIAELIAPITKKRNHFKQVMKGRNILSRAGLLEAGPTGSTKKPLTNTSVTKDGSHIVYHGPGGSATIVKDHKGSKSLNENQLVDKVKKMVEISHPKP